VFSIFWWLGIVSWFKFAWGLFFGLVCWLEFNSVVFDLFQSDSGLSGYQQIIFNWEFGLENKYFRFQVITILTCLAWNRLLNSGVSGVYFFVKMLKYGKTNELTV